MEHIITWQDEDYDHLLGVISINNLSEDEFIIYILKLIQIIKKVGDKYWIYDISNFVVLRLQNNEKLKYDHYELLSIFIEYLWRTKPKGFIELEEIKEIIYNLR